MVKKIFISLMVLGLTVLVSQVQAASLSVISVDGSNSLRLGRVMSGLDNKKELRLRISNADGKRYQVFQSLLGPIVNEKGERLDPKAIEFASVGASNSSGTLYMQNIDHLSMSEQLVYTSGRNGESDAFEIAYMVRPDLLNVSGNFSGRIAFTLRPVEGGAQSQQIINVFLESSADWKAMVVGGRVPGRVTVRDTGAVASMDDVVKVSFSGNAGREVQIYQEVEFLPQNEMAQEIGEGVIRFYTDGKAGVALRVREPQPFKQDRVLLYSGRAPEDSFEVYFSMAKEQARLQQAGIYTGRVKYIIMAGGQESAFPIELECHIAPVFSMDLTFPPEGISFSRVLADEPPAEKEVQVVVHSNVHKPYQVTQEMADPMRSDKGHEIDPEYFTMKVIIPDGEKGKSKFTELAPVRTGDRPVFVSDRDGAPARFFVLYRVQGYKDLPGGRYKAPIRFSLNQN